MNWAELSEGLDNGVLLTWNLVTAWYVVNFLLPRLLNNIKSPRGME